MGCSAALKFDGQDNKACPRLVPGVGDIIAIGWTGQTIQFFYLKFTMHHIHLMPSVILRIYQNLKL